MNILYVHCNICLLLECPVGYMMLILSDIQTYNQRSHGFYSCVFAFDWTCRYLGHNWLRISTTIYIFVSLQTLQHTNGLVCKYHTVDLGGPGPLRFLSRMPKRQSSLDQISINSFWPEKKIILVLIMLVRSNSVSFTVSQGAIVVLMGRAFHQSALCLFQWAVQLKWSLSDS